MKKVSFRQRLRLYRKSLGNSDRLQEKFHLLEQLAASPLKADASLDDYHHVLLFTCAFPTNKQLHSLAEKELKRITTFLKKKKKKKKEQFLNSGLPFTNYYSSFTHDFNRWLLTHPDCKIQFSEVSGGTRDLNEVLQLVLPSLLRSETTSGLSNIELLKKLGVKKSEYLKFLITELGKLDQEPFIKDNLNDSLNLYCDIIPRNKNFSLSYNRLPVSRIIYQEKPVTSFDFRELINLPVDKARKLSNSERKKLVTVIKNSMALKDRETDTVTYMAENSLRLYQLENGVSIAIYGMIPERQLPLESYVGYTLFSNGFPVAYGGAWVFGAMANFGINIFESFRGGESGYIMCQLLRLYRQVFGVSYFEIEPYQYGLDNPEGIKTGAFWFYYRFGFRPLARDLSDLALKEKRKIKADRGYRSSKEVLVRFTDSNMALQLDKGKPLKVADITSKVIRLVSKKYGGNTVEAEKHCIENFRISTGFNPASMAEQQVLKDVSLWAAAFTIQSKKKLQMMTDMVRAKPKDLYQYNEILRSLLKLS